jgi:TATA-binding protein-associated factor Taf7
MVTDFCDDLNALDAPTSEIDFRSGTDELDDYLENEDLDDDAESEDESGSGDQSEEDDETAPQLVETTDQIRKLHSECLKRGKKVFKKMKQQIEEAKPFILTLRDNIFRYRQGSSGNVIAFSDDMLGMDGKPLGKLSWPQLRSSV